ncbi:hypothetical protein Tco_0318234 [Tanacetum coccineum]
MNFKGTEGVVGMTQWLEKMESVFHISNCTVAYTVSSDEEWEEHEYGNPPNNSFPKPYLKTNDKRSKNYHKKNNEDTNKSGDMVLSGAPHSEELTNGQLDEKVCKVEKFEVLKYSVGDSEEFLAICTRECNSWAQTVNGVSMIYHDIFQKKDDGWTEPYSDLAESMMCLDRSIDSDKYLEGQSMQRPPLFKRDSFIYWKNRFETYVKLKDLDLWHVITNGDFQPIVQNLETKLDEVIPFEKQTDDLKKRLAKNNEAKMAIYNALPRNEYETIFMCNKAKEIWKTLLITHQGNSQVKDNKIDLLVQKYEQFVILEDKSIDSAFARFNTIITSLKALHEGYSSKNYVRKFLRALHPKWRAKVTAIEESKDLTSLSLEEVIGNLKVYETIIKKDSKIVKAKVEKKSIALKAKKESTDEECRYSWKASEATSKRQKDVPKKLGEEDDEKVKDEMCLVAHASSEVCSESSYISDENSSIDDLALDNEYDKLCKMSLKIITKNKRLKATRNSLENELRELKDKLSTLEKNKGVDIDCAKCHTLKIENEKLKEESTRLNKFEKSTHCLNEMLNNQKPSGDKLGLGFNSFEASSSGTKEIKFVKAQKKASPDGGPINMGGPLNVQAAPKINMGPPPATPGSEKTVSFQKSILGPRPKHIIVNKVKIHVASDNEVKQFYKPLTKPGVGFSKTNFRSKTPPPRRVNNNYSRPKTPQPKRHIG